MLSHKLLILFFPVFIFFALCNTPYETKTPEKQPFTIIAYYPGDAESIDAYPIEKLTHIIYSFCHLRGNKLVVDDAKDSTTIRKLVSLKQRKPGLKVLLSLGGWGGCKTCSSVFSDEAARKEFALSVKKLQEEYHTDGIDLDWEYPGIPGPPGHEFMPADKQHFTLLIQELRQALGPGSELSFAAGGFDNFFDNSVEWDKVMPLVNRANLMTYDLKHGYSDTTGHHTPLHATPQQKDATDHAVEYLEYIGVPLNKMVIGAAFYGRVWENVDSTNNGLFQPGKFKRGVSFKTLDKYLDDNPGYIQMWDDQAKAPYAYNENAKLFLTYDDLESVKLKTEYAKKKGLEGIMFWQLGSDNTADGLLEAIYKASLETVK